MLILNYFTLLLIYGLATVRALLVFYTIKNFTFGGVVSTMEAITFSQNMIAFQVVQQKYTVSTSNVITNTPVMKMKIKTFTNGSNLRVPSSSLMGMANNYLIFNNSQLVKYTSNFSAHSILYTTVSNMIVDSFFLNSDPSICVILIKNSVNLHYELLFYKNNAQINIGSLQQSSLQIFIKSDKENNNFYLVFETKILKFCFTNNTLQQLGQINLPAGNSPKSLSVDSTFLAYSYNDTVFILENTNLSIVYSQVLVNSTIMDIKIIPHYLLISTLSNFYQYDLDIQIVISIVQHSFNLSSYKLAVISNLYGIFYLKSASKNLYVYNITYTIQCTNGCISCLDTYMLNTNNSVCQKNVTIPANEINATYFNSSLLNQSLNISNSTMENNMSVNMSWFNFSNSSLAQLNVTNESTIIVEEKKVQKEQSQQISQKIGSILCFSSVYVLPKFTKAFSILLEDYYYYRKHNFEYQQKESIFFQSIVQINQVRLDSWFLDEIPGLDFDVAEEENKRYAQVEGSKIKFYQTIYFLSSSKEVYVDSLIINLIIFFSLKLLVLSFYFLRKYHKIPQYLFNHLHNGTKWWAFLLSFVQTNIIRLSYKTAVQILYSYSFNFFNKLNILIAVLLFGLLLFYVANFRLFISKIQTKQNLTQMLPHSYYHRKSFLLESYAFTFRNLLRGFLQAIFIESYLLTITTLIVSDVIFILVCIAFFTYFTSKVLFFSLMVYSLSFLGLNLSFMLLYKFEWIKKKMVESVPELNFILIIFISATSLLCVLIIMVQDLKQLYDKYWVRSKEMVDCQRNQNLAKKSDKGKSQIFIEVEYLKKQLMPSKKSERLKVKTIVLSQKQIERKFEHKERVKQIIFAQCLDIQT